MPPEDKAILNARLADYHRRIGLGESIDPAHYKAELGPLFPAFEKLLLESAMIDDKRNVAKGDELPRAFGGYTLLKELGRGASGVVYEAVNRELGRRVALKVLRTGFDTHVTARERFRREARACAQIRHDNVVEIYEAGVEEDRPYYAMRLLEGVSLSESIADGALPELPKLIEQMADIAGALHVLHEGGIVHRDVKPSNLMVQPDGRFILADFGLARTTDAVSLTQTGDALGTPLYMSPEQMLGKREEIDGRTDIYGLGATLYQAVTGKTPFETKDLGRLLKMVLTERPAAPRKINPSVPKACEQMILKCLEKRPDDRYASALELEKDLRAFARGDQVEGKPVSATRHGVRRLITSPVGIAAIVLGIVAGVLLAMNIANAPKEPVLIIDSTPVAGVWIDGAFARDTPTAKLTVAPGDRVIEIRAKEPGYTERKHLWTARPGAERIWDVILAPLAFDDPKKLEAYQKKLGFEGVPLRTKSGDRAGGEEHAYPLLMMPSGRMLARTVLRDGFAARVDIPTDFDDQKAGQLVFYVGKREVARIDFPNPMDDYLLDVPIPTTVQDALRKALTAQEQADEKKKKKKNGADAAPSSVSARWEYVRGKRTLAFADFTIEGEASSLAAILTRIDEQIEHHPNQRMLRAFVLADLYLAQELYGDALLELLPFTDPLKGTQYQKPDSPKPNLRVLLIARDALTGLFKSTPKKAWISPMWSEVNTAVKSDDWSAAEKQAAYRLSDAGGE